MSRGAADAAEALAAGARPAGLVLVSGVYGRVIPALRNNPDLLPTTLVVHHARDTCKFTLPGAANEFVAWSRGKARVNWINTTGEPSSNPCNAQGAHGFSGRTGLRSPPTSPSSSRDSSGARLDIASAPCSAAAARSACLRSGPSRAPDLGSSHRRRRRSTPALLLGVVGAIGKAAARSAAPGLQAPGLRLRLGVGRVRCRPAGPS